MEDFSLHGTQQWEMLSLSMGQVALGDNKQIHFFHHKSHSSKSAVFARRIPACASYRFPEKTQQKTRKHWTISPSLHTLFLLPSYFQSSFANSNNKRSYIAKDTEKNCSRWYSATCASLNHLPHHWEEGRELNNRSDTNQSKCRGSGLNTGGQGLILLCVKSLHSPGCTSNPSLTTLFAFSSNDPGAFQNGISINEN